MNDFQEEVNRVWDTAVFLQMLAAFSDELNFEDYSRLMLDIHKLIQGGNCDILKRRLPEYEKKLVSIALSLSSKYPRKRPISEIAKDWDEKCKTDKEILSNGIMIGWLEEQIDLKYFKRYDYYPYQFKIGLVINKGRGEVEEHFLLKDSFLCLIKAKNRLRILNQYGEIQKKKFNKIENPQVDIYTMDSINAIKYEVSFYSRMTIISFFSFLESFINSIGFDFYYRNRGKLKSGEEELLQGTNLNQTRFLSLKNKIEKYQEIIRSDSVAKIVLSDPNQIKAPFKTLFEKFNELRNASVHYSPKKARIWLKPHDWVNEAEEFSKLVIQSALEIWKSCHEVNKGPDYLGRLEYDRLYKIANDQEKEIRKIAEYLK